MTQHTPLNLAEAIATRLCHDLAGPISAVGNGIELLASETDPSMQRQARELLHMSAQEGIARLQFLRTAFGQLKDIRSADSEETRLMAQQFFTHSPIKLDWPSLTETGFDGEIANHLRQILCGMILFTGSMLPFGGTLSVRMEPTSKLIVTGTHKRLKDDPQAIAFMQGVQTPESYTPYNVVPCFLRQVAAEAGIALRCDVSATGEIHTIQLLAENRE
jgi:histidine phosphotransferase ChpT